MDINLAKCPKCGERLLRVNVEELPGSANLQDRYRCVTFSCPHGNCRAILSVQLAPEPPSR